VVSLDYNSVMKRRVNDDKEMELDGKRDKVIPFCF
jgi:hypothetical protein